MVDVLVDGQPDDRVPADDRGLLYGDHLFETIAFVGDRAPLWTHHMQRLVDDAARLLIPPPDPALLADECRRITAGHDRSVVRITITRGSGGRAYEPPEVPVPRRILFRRPWPEHLERQQRDGLAMILAPVRLAAGGELAGIKHGNRLEQVLAASAARRAGADEALLLDHGGRLVEAVSSNIVARVDQRWITPPLERAGVRGVGLRWLSSRDQLDLESAEIDAGQLDRLEALVVINSVAGIRPVIRLDDVSLPVDPEIRRWQRLWNRLFECAD
jgi:4-amino-4-deoxychorismate lyase